MKISIIIPVYNAQKCVERCVETVLGQTFNDFEAILVDDGSTDNSSIICDELAKKDSRIKVIHKQNGGVSSARNAGLDVATGEYIQFVDSDDKIESNMTEQLYSAITNSSSEVAVTGYKVFNEKITDQVSVHDNITVDVKELKNEFNYLYKNWLINPIWNKLYKKSLIKDNFDPEKKIGEDTWFNLQYLLNVKRVSLVTGSPYIYDITTENSLTKIVRDDFFEIEKGQYTMITDFATKMFGEKGVVKSAAEIFFKDANANVRTIIKQKLKSKAEVIEIIKKISNDDVFIQVCKEISVSAKQHKIFKTLVLRKRYSLIYLFYKLKAVIER